MLSVNDLRIGMRVNTYQLSGIYNTYILLSQTELNDDGSTSGTIEFVGEKQTQEMLDVINYCKEKYGKKPMVYAHAYLPDGVYSKGGWKKENETPT